MVKLPVAPLKEGLEVVAEPSGPPKRANKVSRGACRGWLELELAMGCVEKLQGESASMDGVPNKLSRWGMGGGGPTGKDVEGTGAGFGSQI